MNEKKICFILCANDSFLAKECAGYIQNLIVPEGYETEIQTVYGAKSMTAGYNEGMRQSDAKYKVYLHQDVLIVHRGFLMELLRIFTEHPMVGMFGVVGNRSLAEDGCPWSDGMWRRIGSVYVDAICRKQRCVFAEAAGDYERALVLDGLLMATQYDLPWREDLFAGWDFYDCSQSLEFWKAGYEVAVPHMEEPWCLHDNDILHLEDYEKWRCVFEQEYKAFYMGWQNRKKAVYQFFMKGDSPLPFPYPPVYMDSNTDYICFTDRQDVTSKYWRIVRLDKKGKSGWHSAPAVRHALTGYISTIELFSNQIQCGSLFSGEKAGCLPFETVPSLHGLPCVDFDEKRLVPTADEKGNYRYEKNPVYKGGLYGGRERLLTVGIPVSNQIKTIERCLLAIKPLLDRLDAELLIIDTGSTDGTVEICRRFGARIVKFAWCDNMSAVRNIGIRNAKGAWYLSADDDEWFEDVNNILDFFLSGKYRNYDAATYVQRNYIYSNTGVFIDSHALRMARIVPNLHFEGRIHDALMIMPHSRVKNLLSYANHKGFLRDDWEKIKEKYIRNTQGLLLDMYEYPLDLRYNLQLANELETFNDYKDAVPFFFRGIAIEREQPNPSMGRVHAAALLASLYNVQSDRLFTLMELLKNAYDYTDAERAFFDYSKADVGLRQSHAPQEILTHYHSYVEYRKRYEENPVWNAAHTYTGLYVCTNEPYLEDAHVIGFCAYCGTGDAEHAIEELAEIHPEKIFDQEENLFTCLLSMEPSLFEAVIDHMSLVQFGSWGEKLFEGYIGRAGEGKERELVNLSVLVRNMNIPALEYFLKRCCCGMEQTECLSDRALRLEVKNLSVPELYFYSSILKRRFAGETDVTACMELFLCFIEYSGNFSARYYHPALLEDEESKVIPVEERAAWQIFLALRETVVSKEMIRRLRKALALFPGYKREISILIREIVGREA